MNLNSLVAKIKYKYKAYQKELKRKRLEEEARQQQILSGDIKPIFGQYNLNQNEKAYFECEVDRMATVEYTVEKTTGKAKKKGILGRAIVGGVLFGVPGAIIGGVTAGSKQDTKTTQAHIQKTEEIDTGKFLLTNKRVLFLGEKNIVSIPYADVVTFEVDWSHEAIIKYPTMLTGEFYKIRGDNRNDIELYYKGIRSHIFKS